MLLLFCVTLQNYQFTNGVLKNKNFPESVTEAKWLYVVLFFLACFLLAVSVAAFDTSASPLSPEGSSGSAPGLGVDEDRRTRRRGSQL
jgi:hypothetical protein